MIFFFVINKEIENTIESKYDVSEPIVICHRIAIRCHNKSSSCELSDDRTRGAESTIYNTRKLSVGRGSRTGHRSLSLHTFTYQERFHVVLRRSRGCMMLCAWDGWLLYSRRRPPLSQALPKIRPSGHTRIMILMTPVWFGAGENNMDLDWWTFTVQTVDNAQTLSTLRFILKFLQYKFFNLFATYSFSYRRQKKNISTFTFN